MHSESTSPNTWDQDTGEIVALMDRLPVRSPVRRIAFDLYQDRAQDLPTIRPLLYALADSDSRRWPERMVAAWSLGRAPLDSIQRADATDALLDILEDSLPPDADRLRKGILQTLASVVAGVAVLAALMVSVPSLVELLITLSVASTTVAPFVILYLLFVSDERFARDFAASDARSDRLRAIAATALGQLRAVEAVCPLAKALFDSSAIVRAAAKPALRRAMAGLTSEHYGMIEMETVPNLCKALHYGDEALVLDVLLALEKVGDGRALPHVARAAASGRSSRICELATSLLPILKERRRRQVAPQTLLRPSVSPCVPAESLGRPANLLVTPARYAQEVLHAED